MTLLNKTVNLGHLQQDDRVLCVGNDLRIDVKAHNRFNDEQNLIFNFKEMLQ